MTSGEERDLAALLSAAQAGDGAAYRALLTWLVPALRSHLGGDEARVQTALLRLHRLRGTWRPGRRVRPWSALIAEPAGRPAAALPLPWRFVARIFSRRAGKARPGRV